MRKNLLLAAAASLIALGCGAAAHSQGASTVPQGDVAKITPLRDALGGQEPGDDYFLANYTQLSRYMETVSKQSDRAKLVEMGRTAEGRPQYMMIISSPENIRNLDKYKAIAARLARAEGLAEDEARALAREGKAVIYIGSGMHGNETATPQSMMAQVHRALTDNDPEWLRILDDTILLLAHNNPDGHELLANWYMRNPDPKNRIGGQTHVSSTPLSDPPQLYHKYTGHDNNRDFLAITQPESRNIARVLFREWFPQVIYDHHQKAPPGAVVFLPPFRSPVNSNLDPLSMTALGEIGYALHSRLIAEDKPGSVMGTAGPFSLWFNGSLRTTSYFHNAIGILSEINGNATPMSLPLKISTQLAQNDFPEAAAPGILHLRDTVAYELSLNRGLLDYASRNRERLLYNIYKMGADSIARGSKDHWTITPSKLQALETATAQAGKPAIGEATPELYKAVLNKPEQRDARAYIIPADQADYPTAIKFLNALIRSGVTVHRTDQAFSVSGRTYPAGSFAVLAAQAYRPHVLDSFEPQDHPTDLQYPGGPPVRPYDQAGYTLAFQMGVKFDRIIEGFQAPLTPVRDEIAPPPGRIVGSGRAGFLIDHKYNDAATLTNRLLKSGIKVHWLKGGVTASGRQFVPGAIWVPNSARARAILEAGTREFGIDAFAQGAAPAGEKLLIRRPRIGLVDVYFGSMASGWIRWLLEQNEFPYEVVHPQRLDAGGLRRDFDIIVMPDELRISRTGRPQQGRQQPDPKDIPPQFRPWLGEITAAKTAPQLKSFVEAGGTLLAMGNSAAVGYMIGLPFADVTLEGTPDKPQVLPSTRFFIPYSLLRASVDITNPVAFGMDETVDLPYNNNPIFRIPAGAANARQVASFTADKPLSSGWAIGQDFLKGTSPVVEVSMGKGKVLLMGSEVTQRAQPHGAFKLFFNGLFLSAAEGR